MRQREEPRGARGRVTRLAVTVLSAMAAGCGGGGGGSNSGATSAPSSDSGGSTASVTGLSCTGSAKGTQMYCTAAGSNLQEGMQFSATGCTGLAEAPNGNSTYRSFVCAPQQAGTSAVAISSGSKSLWNSTVQITDAPTTLSVVSAGGLNKTVVVRSDGSVWLFGRRYSNGGTSTGPLIVGSGYVKAAATDDDVVAIKADGSLWDIQATDGVLHQIGTGFVDVRGGSDQLLGLKADGSLWAWGGNAWGQVGNGTTTAASVPQAILQNVVAFDAGFGYSMAVKSDGTVWAWGSPALVAGPSTPVQIAAGYTKVFRGGTGILALRADGSLWSLGWGGSGADVQVATHVKEARGSLVLLENETVWQAQDVTAAPWALSPVSGLPSTMVAIAASGADYAIDDMGQLWGWGSLADGALGGDAPTFKTLPTIVGNVGAAPKSLAAGDGNLLVVDSAGAAYEFGIDVSQFMSQGPSAPALPFQPIGSGISQVALGDGHAAAIKSDGSLWTWGANWMGELGVGDTQSHTGMQKVGDGYVSVAATRNSTIAVKADGTLWSWGDNEEGELGTGTGGVVGAMATSPQEIGTGYKAVAAGDYGVLALKSDGSIWGWGEAPGGALFAKTPTHVADGFVQIAAGGNGWLAVKADGTAWSMTNDIHRTMLQIGTNVKQVAANGNFSMLLSKDGTLWTWGDNSAGQLGNGTTGSVTVAAQRVGTNITAIAAGYSLAAAVDANGNVLAWGGWPGFSATWPGSPTTQTPSPVRF